MKKYALLATLLLLPLTSFANESEQAAARMCEKMKVCVTEMMAAQQPEMDEQTRAMVNQQIDGMCVGITANFSQASTIPDMDQSAAACLDSMTALSCDTLMGGQPQTSQCDEFEKKVKKYEQENG